MRNGSLEKRREASLLCDLYGSLITERQREIVRLYCDEDLTMAEIGEELGISRQAASDHLKKAVQALQGYEEKLGLLKAGESGAQNGEDPGAEDAGSAQF